MHQGWPKFTSHLWMKTTDGGLAAAAWAPCRVDTKVRDVPVTVDVDTDYPFRESISVAVTVARAARFPIVLRVPAWAEGAVVRIGSAPEVPMTPGTLHRIDREWSGTTALSVRFPMRPLISVRYDDAIAVERGPLVYSLRLGEQWTRVNADKPHREVPHCDYEVRPTTPWNYGLVADERNTLSGIRFEERPVGPRPFSPDGAGVVARARARRIPGWKIVRGWAGELAAADVQLADPASPISDQPLEEVELIPYGCTNIRITEFPRVRGA
jgi:hypothetical protein